ncbi:MFS transporter [Allorhizocola rhizosphaerae]|uniref:MFS transporter n=1 Tax=Allorhizocola rhizosphaerae TaxID=1872709 RepID=UPI000E3C513B|nr:MFS transporter [Allorhizocola rhizosphaerae]
MAQTVRRGRWLMLAAFGTLVAGSQILWLSFAPITSQAHEALGVSEGAIGDLAVINPLMFVLLAIPAGRWTDRRFGAALATGALLTALGASLRLVDPSSYAWMLAGQFVLSAGQPLVLNASTKVAARYFPPAERTAAISVASAAQFVGILVAAMTGAPLLEAGGLQLVLACHAGVAVVAALAVVFALRVPPAFATEATATSLGWLRRDPLMWRLAGLLFIGVGVFNALATWLDTILTGIGRPGVAGTLIAVATVAGIAGAAVLPGIAARRNLRRGMLVCTTVITALVFVSIALVDNVLFTGFALAVEGFVLLAGLPIALDWSELDAGPTRAGTAAGFLMLVGNLGGVVLVLLVQVLLGNPYLALAAMSAVAVPGIVLAARLPARAPSAKEVAT